MNLAKRLLDDRRSGIVVDADGRRWFRPRRVTFRTISVEGAELLASGWLGFDSELAAPDWSAEPSHDAIRDFAHEASRRHIEFWYRVIDVAVARALGGTDRRIFEIPFFAASSQLDIGLPETAAESSIPPPLHAAILAEYRHSREREHARVFYLSDYLSGLTDDVRHLLEPYRALWRLRRGRRRLLLLEGPMAARLQRLIDDSGAGDAIRSRIQDRVASVLARAAAARAERAIASPLLRDMIQRSRRGWRGPFSADEVREALRARELEWDGNPRLLSLLLQLPLRAARSARSAIAFESAAHRLELRRARLIVLLAQHPDGEIISNLDRRIRSYRERQHTYLEELERHLVSETTLASPWKTLAYLARAAASEPGALVQILDAVEARRDPVPGDFSAPVWIGRTLRALIRLTGRLERAGRRYAALHEGPGQADSLPFREVLLDEAAEAARFPGCAHLELPGDLRVGDPYREREVVAAARALILKRLRPVRQSAGIYTLVPEHRHGALPLNPVMKLWKDRPTGRVRDEPPILGLQFNTKETVACLLELARLADAGITERAVARGRIARLNRTEETFETLRAFLLPGSCYPLREINRSDFPEFRGRVIGETRSPHELGVPSAEMSILTGGWYKKRHHCLYYPVGGDNAGLLTLIWRSARASGPPAFFFALGQFVHDCLPDELIYYRSGTRTFRQCVEDYYRTEDRYRRDRGERTGRRRPDNTRHGVRFMFAVTYSRAVLEILTGSSQIQFRHALTEKWFAEHLRLPVLSIADRSDLRRIRAAARECIRAAGS